MIRSVLVILILTAAIHLPSVTLAADPTASCDRGSPGTCKISWKFDEASYASYFVEQFDLENQQWTRVYGPVDEASGTTEGPVSEGYLYRAVGCNASPEEKCASSTTAWAAIHFASADEIPETVHGGANDHVFSVSKDASFEAQRQQYNAYRLFDLYERIEDWGAMPSMTEPPKDPMSSDEEWVHDDLIHYVAFSHYGPISNAPAER